MVPHPQPEYMPTRPKGRETPAARAGRQSRKEPGAGAPATVTENETLDPGSTVCEEGGTVIDGLTNKAGVVMLAVFE